jgi:hypothetical protein
LAAVAGTLGSDAHHSPCRRLATRSPARRSTMSDPIRRKFGHIEALLGELAPDPWQQSPER